MSSPQVDATAEGFALSNGLELVEVSATRAQGKVLVREELKGPLGNVHAGVFAQVAEILTGIATTRALAAEAKAVAPLANQTSFLEPITEGAVHALALAKHQGRTTWVWEVEFSDDQGRVCVLTRMTISVRDAAET